jgi:CRP-like cAMP-binding protein
MEENPLVRKLEGYAPLSEEDKRVIRDLSAERVVKVRARHDIIRDGAATDYIHLILDGWAARYKVLPDGTRQITAFLIPGDFCDLHVTILSTMDHGIVALTPCTVANLDSAKLDRITSERSMLTKALWWMTLVDEAVLRQWIVNARRQAIAAVAHLICELHIRLKSVGLAQGPRIELPLTQEVLADATGMTPVHMNRTLQTLREHGLIELKHGSLRIPDVAALATVGGFDDSYLHLRKGRRRKHGP